MAVKQKSDDTKKYQYIIKQDKAIDEFFDKQYSKSATFRRIVFDAIRTYGMNDVFEKMEQEIYRDVLKTESQTEEG